MFAKRLHSPASLGAALSVLALVFAIAGGLTAGAVGAQAELAAKKTDRIATATAGFCENQTWPNVSSACLSWVSGKGKSTNGFVRTVTLEQRDEGARTSILTRVPVMQTASR
ncbi:hypothetical protein [Rhodobium gokarnense]|uniref:Uncharacterized protein n=1 Tax=Rhodobium gokarnense TaxID=364296 RepID=A0ABT3HFW1_9HYPH|nr:hypothetical protein [Rhodobium gokarnense]MCW2309239.1 hypothetical protein [Rhodobium gokarnense]